MSHDLSSNDRVASIWHRSMSIFENTVLVGIIVVFILSTTLFLMFASVLTRLLILLQSRGLVASCEEVVERVFWPLWLLVLRTLG